MSYLTNMTMPPTVLSVANFSLQLQTHTCSCLLEISTWVPHRYLKFNMSENDGLSFYHKPLLLEGFPSSADGNSILSVIHAKSLWIIVDHFLHAYSCHLDYCYSLLFGLLAPKLAF